MGSKKTDQEARRRYRRRLAEEGVLPEEIERLSEQLRIAHQSQRDTQRPPTASDLRSRKPHGTRTMPNARKVYPAAVVLTEDDGPKGVEYLDLIQEETYARLAVDDTKFRPRAVDPLLRGGARVTARTAKAAARSKATTKYELDQEANG